MTRIVCRGFGLLCTAAVLVYAWPALSGAGEPTGVKGRITDSEGRPTEGARVFAYDSADVRRPANFISTLTDRDGAYRLILLPGKYWLVARYKQTEGYGPLLPGDRHSGDAEVVELPSGREMVRDFMIADLRAARKAHARGGGGLAAVSGRITDEKGVPAANTYAFAHSRGRIDTIPDHISAWTDQDGRFTLRLPRGTYYIGCARVFPPEPQDAVHGAMTVDADLADVELVLRFVDSR